MLGAPTLRRRDASDVGYFHHSVLLAAAQQGFRTGALPYLAPEPHHQGLQVAPEIGPTHGAPRKAVHLASQVLSRHSRCGDDRWKRCNGVKAANSQGVDTQPKGTGRSASGEQRRRAYRMAIKTSCVTLQAVNEPCTTVLEVTHPVPRWGPALLQKCALGIWLTEDDRRLYALPTPASSCQRLPREG